MEYYRYEAVNYGTTVNLRLETYRVVKETPCGYWVQLGGWDRKRWVSKTSRKRHCYPSKEGAMASYQARKTRHLQILRAQLANAEYAIQLNEEKQSVSKHSKDWFEVE